MLVLLTSLALTSENSHCLATWNGTIPHCAIQGEIASSATGPSQNAAERLARKRLGRVAEMTAADLVAVDAEIHEAEFWGCAATAMEQAELTCSRAWAPTEGNLCFVTFDDPECWDGRVLTVEETWERAIQTGRDRMCEEVDARQLRLNYTNLEQRRANCQQSCATSTIVSCPSQR